jgi:hypothetical protein
MNKLYNSILHCILLADFVDTEFDEKLTGIRTSRSLFYYATLNVPGTDLRAPWGFL